MWRKRGVGDLVFDACNTIFLLGLVVVTVYPLLYVAFASLSNPTAVAQHRGVLLRPVGLTLDAYRLVFTNPMITIGYRNTLLYVVAGTTINLIMTCLGAYALSRKNVLLGTPVMFMIVFTMFFSGGLVPDYLLVANTLDWINTPWAVIIPPAISTLNLIIMRTAFSAVPEALIEAARMDGANDLTILARVVLPLAMPVVAVMLLFYGVAHWNSWFPAMIYLRSRDLYPLQLVLREILIISNVDQMTTGIASGDVMPIGETIKYATVIVATVPILCAYPFLQRYFVRGVMIGAIRE
ncbi:MAG: carbohydrate ABC transporter permease [Anaerolineae bacterium]|nr:carbohydrate ABC transporter permease [Anaerolineae bacterium]